MILTNTAAKGLIDAISGTLRFRCFVFIFFSSVLLFFCSTVYFISINKKWSADFFNCLFYGNLNNTLSVLGRNRNEISTVHLVNSYCIPSLLYGCEIWSLNSSDYRKLNVIWNNAFRNIFQCCWRESVSCLFHHCKTLLCPILLTKEKFFLSRECGIVVRSISTM